MNLSSLDHPAGDKEYIFNDLKFMPEISSIV